MMWDGSRALGGRDRYGDDGRPSRIHTIQHKRLTNLFLHLFNTNNSPLNSIPRNFSEKNMTNPPKILRKKNWLSPHMHLLLTVCGNKSNQTRAIGKLQACHTYDAFILGIFNIDAAFHGRIRNGFLTRNHLKEFRRLLLIQERDAT